MTNDSFKCESTESLLAKRKDAELAIKYERIRKGCGVIKKEVKVEIDGINFHSCLCHENFRHPLFNFYLQIHTNYKRGVLAFAGGLLDQPAHLMDIMSLLDKLESDFELEQQKKLAEKGKRK